MKVMVTLADGFEDIEAITVVDILKRAGVKVDTVGVVGSVITSAQGIRVMVDKRISEVNPEEYDGIILPGGNPGYINLGRASKVIEILKRMDSQGKLIAAICGSPAVLAKAGVLENKKATISPGMEKELPYPRADRVVVDGNVITSQSPGTAMEFSLALVEKLVGRNKVSELRKTLVI